MKIKIKVLYDDKYKEPDTFEAAIDRWKWKGWNLADVVQDFQSSNDDAAAILWRPDTGK